MASAQTVFQATRTFGPFRLALNERALYEGQRKLPLGARAYEILVALTDQPGELVTKADLIARVWGEIYVDEAALRVHISGLRKVLGNHPSGSPYIANVTGRGYRFVGDLVETRPQSLPTESSPPELPAELLAAAAQIIGRDLTVQTIVDNLPVRHFVTITGPGGMGKTTVAVAVASRLASQYREGVQFVDLTSTTDPSLLLQKIASTLKLVGLSFKSEADLIDLIHDRRMLLILDNCEHLVEPIALLAERIRAAAPDVHIMTTSRDPLRATGEWVHRLPPLALPPLTPSHAASEVLKAPAAALLVQRAREADDAFVLTEADLPSLVSICHRVDGIPLAIELAAARVNFLGIRTLATQLEESFSLLNGGRRTALPRQRTLQATLDWSYQLLGEDERALLRRLSIFHSSFSLSAAAAIAEEVDPALLLDGLEALTSKSLVSIVHSPRGNRYKLLETTRQYALGKLTDNGEADVVLHRHARFFHDLLARAEEDWPRQAEVEWFALYAHTVADVRAAIDWLLKQPDFCHRGIDLTTQASVLWFALGIMDEYRDLAERAIDVMRDRPGADPETAMRLHTWLAAATYNTLGPVPRMESSYGTALELAVETKSTEFQLYALWGLAAYHNTIGDYRANLTAWQQFSGVIDVSQDGAGQVVRDRNMAAALCFMGRLSEARSYAERALSSPSVKSKGINASFHQIDNDMASRMHMARIMWLMGYADRAAFLVAEAVDKSAAPYYSPALCTLLVTAACPVSLWSGDAKASVRYLNMLEDQTVNRHNYWRGWWVCYAAAAKLGPDDASAAFNEAIRTVIEAAGGPVQLEMMATIRQELVGDVSLARAQRGDALWCAPEILRAHAMRVFKRGGESAWSETERILLTSLALGKEQGALAWQLRTGISLGRLYLGKGRRAQARDILGPIYDQFTEGLHTADFSTATRMLDQA